MTSDISYTVQHLLQYIHLYSDFQIFWTPSLFLLIQLSIDIYKIIGDLTHILDDINRLNISMIGGWDLDEESNKTQSEDQWVDDQAYCIFIVSIVIQRLRWIINRVELCVDGGGSDVG